MSTLQDKIVTNLEFRGFHFLKRNDVTVSPSDLTSECEGEKKVRIGAFDFYVSPANGSAECKVGVYRNDVRQFVHTVGTVEEVHTIFDSYTGTTKPTSTIRKVCQMCDFSRGMGGGNPNNLYCRGFHKEVNANFTCDAFNGSEIIAIERERGFQPKVVEK